MSKTITAGTTVKIVKSSDVTTPEKQSFIGTTATVDAVLNGGARLKRNRGRYPGASAYVWPLSALKAVRGASKGK